MSMTNQEEFAARLARVRDGAPNTKGTVFVGQDERHHLTRSAPVKQSRGKEIASNGLYPLSLVAAFCLGLLAVALGQYARFQLAQGQAQLEDADLEMMLTAGIGILLSFVLAQVFRLTSKTHKAMQSAGVFAMVCAFHNLAHWFPGPMTVLFSQEWVAQVQLEAPKNSARFRGVYFPLFEAGSAADTVLAADVALPAGGLPAAATPAESPACAAEPGPAVTILQTDNAKKSSKSGHKTISASAGDCASP